MEDELQTLRARCDILSLTLRAVLESMGTEQSAVISQGIRRQIKDLTLTDELADASAAREMLALLRALR